jgi:hypothetical protein
MFPPSQKPPMRGLFIRIGAFLGLVWGFSNGIIGHVSDAMNCTEDGACNPQEESIGAADILLPLGFGVLGGMALGLLVWMFINWLSATR